MQGGCCSWCTFHLAAEEFHTDCCRSSYVFAGAKADQRRWGCSLPPCRKLKVQ